MSIPSSLTPLFNSGSSAAAPDPSYTGLQISRSLRFNSADSAYLSKSYGTSPTSGTTQTVALWVKRSVLGTLQEMFTGYNGSSPENTGIGFLATSDCLRFSFGGASPYYYLITTQVFRDTSAWYHITLSIDTTQATPSNRVKIYVNGIQVTSFSTADYPAQNATSQFALANSNNKIGTTWNHTASFFNGYLTNIHFIDGQALTPSSFTETDATYANQLVPKTYSGSYGTNGFNLLFADNSAATSSTLGNDSSSNNNDWTPNNLSVTAGAGNDSLVDSPTNYGTDTYVGGEVRGNYATWNPLSKQNGAALSNGNLDATYGTSSYPHLGTDATIVLPSSGKWYWEVTVTAFGEFWTGVRNLVTEAQSTYYRDGSASFNNIRIERTTGSGGTANGASYTNNDVIGVAVNCDALTISWYKNGTIVNSAYSLTTVQNLVPFAGHASVGGSSAATVNFGQRAFAYTAPSGYKALCTQNLPASLVTKSNTVFDVVTYTGNSGTQILPNANSTPTSLNFSPGFLWIKTRSVGYSHVLTDKVRGDGKIMFSNSTAIEETTNRTALGTNNFTLIDDGSELVNHSPITYVAWAWNAGTSTVSNTQGSITSQVRANATAGFSVVSFTTQSSSTATVGHGLNVAPTFIIQKIRTLSASWYCYHTSIGAANIILLDSTAASSAGSTIWNSTAPTSTVWTLGNGWAGSYSTIAYCFAPVVGYSSFGSYTGNGSSDGPMVYTGFRPRWILTKRYDGGTNGWGMFDALRPGYNLTDSFLQTQSAGSESTGASAYSIDILSNGFKVKGTDAFVNQSAGTYIYAAFAEAPFNYSRAR